MMKKKSGSGNNKATQTTSQLIQKHTEVYLENGGEIDVIKTGVTSFNYMKKSKNIIISGSKEKP